MHSADLYYKNAWKKWATNIWAKLSIFIDNFLLIAKNYHNAIFLLRNHILLKNKCILIKCAHWFGIYSVLVKKDSLQYFAVDKNLTKFLKSKFDIL